MREGVSNGLAPTIEVLDMGAKNATRHSSDILPYLRRYRTYFAPLPVEVDQMTLKVIKIPLDDVEAVTKHTVKVRRPVWILRSKKGIDVCA